jgi:hypothetical protein
MYETWKSYWGIKRNFYIKEVKAANLNIDRIGAMKPFHTSAEVLERGKRFSRWEIDFMASLN